MKLDFPNVLNQYKINLWGTNEYGFGIAGSTLMYSSRNFHNFYNSSNNLNTFSIDGSGNATMNGGNLIVGNSNSYPNVQLGSTNGHNLGVATIAGAFSTSANAGDLVLRSLNRLLLQSSGGGGYGILIDSSNNMLCNSTSVNGILNVSGNSNFNNFVTLISSLNVSGITTLSNNVILNSSRQNQPKLLLSGTEFYTVSVIFHLLMV